MRLNRLEQERQSVTENGQKLTFHRSSSLSFPATGVFTGSAVKPTNDLEAACEVLKTKGHCTAQAVLMNGKTFKAFYENAQIFALGNNWRMQLYVIGTNPGPVPSFGVDYVKAGAGYEGFIKIGSYTLYIFTYNGTYNPTDTTISYYQPDGEVLVFDPYARFDRAFGPSEMTADAIDDLLYETLFGISTAEITSEALGNVMNASLFDPRMFHFGVEKNGTTGYKLITQAAPIFLPTQVDSVVQITGCL